MARSRGAEPPAEGAAAQRIALSIRQPYAEMILRGRKRIEHRRLATARRGRVYIYAGRLPAEEPEAWEQVGARPEDLPRGLVIGTVEITGCTGGGRSWRWHLARPRRLARPFRPRNRPQPMWFYPL